MARERDAVARERDAAVSSPSQISIMPEADQQMTIHENHPHLLGECRSRLTGSSLRVTADIDPRSEVVFIAENGDELEVVDAKSVRMRKGERKRIRVRVTLKPRMVSGWAFYRDDKNRSSLEEKLDESLEGGPFPLRPNYQSVSCTFSSTSCVAPI
jgi:hypothetical protein